VNCWGRVHINTCVTTFYLNTFYLYFTSVLNNIGQPVSGNHKA